MLQDAFRQIGEKLHYIQDKSARLYSLQEEILP